ncbi:amino acid ABC transporter permease [Mesorhizobium sp.]|uniref:amino acid ABC transporter permease n=1 Tax=Mesorhizobium sp. TaxID=1871066 RepID=UPI000FE6208E|nr:amino acid ABC transporter permease [Mesorhizobium sp.]RWI88873.1 MAG: amino acid ABC transporter permease [Mesorhizobium sp.]
MMLDFSWLPDAWGAILYGLSMAIYILAVTATLGTVASVLGATLRRSRFVIVRTIMAAYVEICRNTPFLAQLFFVFFGLPSLGIRLDPVTAAIVAMTLNFAAYGTEIIRGGIDAVPRGQSEAGMALGLAHYLIFLKIILPQALKVIFPALASQIVIAFLDTAAVSQISVMELTYQADLLQVRTYRPFEVYAFITIVYLVFAIALRKLLYGSYHLAYGAR